MARPVTYHTNLLKYRLFKAFAWITMTVQWLVLNITGLVLWNRRQNRPVQVSQVLAGHRLSFYPDRADFLTIHEGFKPIQYLRRDEVTLYTADEFNAYFVETNEDVDIYSSDTEPLLYQSQFQHAQKLLKVPWEVCHHFAKELAKHGNPKVILLSNTSRCGSTLLAQMFECTGRVLTLSGVEVFVKIVKWPHLLNQRTGILETVIRLYTKPHRMKPLAFLLKPKGGCTPLVPQVYAACPWVHHIFMYRNGQACVNSMMSALSLNPLVTPKPQGKSSTHEKWMVQLLIMEPFHRYFLLRHDVGKLVVDFYALNTWKWASLIRHHLDFVAQGIETPTVKYENLLANPAKTFGTLLRLFGLPPNLAKTGLRAMERDSQRGHVISLEHRKHVIPAMTNEQRHRCNTICSFLEVPRLNDDIRLPNSVL